MSSATQPAAEPPLRILCFDGGGVRGLSSLLILERIMEHVKEAEHLSQVPSPCDRFDLIGGTGTGGAFSAEGLEMAIKEIIRNNCCDPQCVRLRESNGPVTDTNMCPHEDTLFLDENYTKTGCTVWEVAIATSAAVPFFDSIKLGRDNIEFIDVSYGYNNPCEELIAEAENQFPGRQMIVLSIGTGLDDVVEITDLRSSVVEALSKMVTTSKRTDLTLRDKHSGTAVYHRFNVEHGLRDTKVPDFDKWGRILANTTNYLGENKELVKKFVAAFTTSDIARLQFCHDEKDKQCLSDFYEWIIDHQDFQRFRTEKESRILWIKGDPGKGKTMLLCGIIDTLELDSLVDVSYFFCQAANSQVNTATSVLRGLIHDIARRNPQLTKHLRAKYDYMGKAFFANGSLWHSLCDIITALLNDPSLRNVILIVDALDECNVGRRDLLEFIAKPSNAKWIVSSRNWLDIEEILNDAEEQVKIHLEINEDFVFAAVDSYITLKVDQLARRKKYDDDLKLDILRYLRSNAEGTFLWVALVVQELSNENLQNWHAPSELKSLPPGLYPLYGRMQKQMSKSKDADVCKEIIATALAVYRPLTLEELHGLVKPLESLKKENAPGCLIDDVPVPEPDPLAAIRYSCTFWVDHLCDSAETGMESKSDKVLAFIKDKYLQWLEALSLVYNFSVAGRGMDRLMLYLGKSSPILNDIMIDARQFVLFHRQAIEIAPLQVYVSALTFSPTKSLIKQMFRHEEPDWIVLKPKLEGNWSTCLQTPVGHNSEVTLMVFSDDAQQLASGSRDSTVKIWDATSGACLQTLEGHDGTITSVVFLDNGHRLASESTDKTVKIWDATSGKCLQTIPSGYAAYWVSLDVRLRDMGLTVTSAPPPTHQTSSIPANSYSYTLSTDRQWLMKNGQRLLCFPLSYRPQIPAEVASQRLALALSHGRVVFIEFI
ncbi:Vegetative incompatibility protein HET-E-1 [Ceratocystis lukuohia]|uniref:Vegetative incompatibility protein HET-E-1 n=1 Tax=Ceratocystis lukuohia TaxID=2019550 RepID=A0ABR4MLU8_9PEZI